jgi:hypothetical protein
MESREDSATRLARPLRNYANFPNCTLHRYCKTQHQASSCRARKFCFFIMLEKHENISASSSGFGGEEKFSNSERIFYMFILLVFFSPAPRLALSSLFEKRMKWKSFHFCCALEGGKHSCWIKCDATLYGVDEVRSGRSASGLAGAIVDCYPGGREPSTAISPFSLRLCFAAQSFSPDLRCCGTNCYFKYRGRETQNKF